ncbi:MAG: hypothetical protein PVS2B2_27020 [Candidatus Acidiferrum sp.]
MSETEPQSRFLVRKGARENTWMVWDRQERRPAQIIGATSIGLSKEQAQNLMERSQTMS